MAVFNVKWTKDYHSDGFGFVHPLDVEGYLGFLSGDLKKYSLHRIEDQKDVWSIKPQKRSNTFGKKCVIGNHILISEDTDKKAIWHILDIETGESKVAEGLDDETYFRFAMNGYGVFDVCDRPAVIDPCSAKLIEVVGDDLDFSLGFGNNDRYWGYRENLEQDQGITFIGQLTIDSVQANFGDEIELKGNPSKDELSFSVQDDECVIFQYYDDKTSFCVFDWGGILIKEISLLSYASEDGDSQPQGMSAGDGKFVFHIANWEKGKDKFVGIDVKSDEDPWVCELDRGLNFDHITQVSHYIVSPIGTGGLKKDYQFGDKVKHTDDPVTRVIDMRTGEMSVIHNDIGEYTVGTDKGLYYSACSNRSVLSYGEFV